LREEERFDQSARTFTYTINNSHSLVATLDAEHDRPVQISKPGQVPASYTYDDEGRISTMSQGERSVTYQYNERGRLSDLFSGDELVASYEYDSIGRLISKSFANGKSFDLVYTSGSAAHSTGMLSSLTRSDGLQANYTYTERDLISSITRTGLGEISYDYDLGGRLNKVTLADGHERFIYYRDGQVSRVESSAAELPATFTYLSGGRIARTVTHSGISQEWTWDGLMVTEERWSNHPNLTLSWTYGQDLRRAAHSYGGVTYRYEYDEVGRLMRLGGLSFGFNEESGLRDSVSDDTGSIQWSWDEYGRQADWRLEVGESSYQYSLHYDDHDQVTSVVELAPSGEERTLAYKLDVAL